MEHSAEFIDPVSESRFGLARLRSRRCVVLLELVNMLSRSRRVCHVLLEIIQSFLPTSITLDPYFDASKNHLLSTPEIDTKLYYIAVVDGPWLTLDTWRAQSKVV
jgi:hypothetical protein